jgi:hypothetical protein
MCGCGDKGVSARISFVLLAIAAPVFAHVVSMSTGELRIDGPLADYELRIPMVEVAQMADPSSILDYIRFDGGHRRSVKCADEDGTYVCHASYEFETLVPERLGVECKFFEATVPNHVHWLHAVRGANSDQEVFDQTYPRSELRFRPPSRIETFAREFGLGFARAARNWIGLLFIFGLAVAARAVVEDGAKAGTDRSVHTASDGGSTFERGGALGQSGQSRFSRTIPLLGFLIGEAAAVLIGPRIPWPMAPRFLEAAMALTVAYLAVEILMATDARNLAWIVGVLGTFHGLSVSGFPWPYSVAAGVLQVALFAGLAWVGARVSGGWRKRIGWGLLAVGVGGFLFRVVVR